jgi:hypothetical protein
VTDAGAQAALVAGISPLDFLTMTPAESKAVAPILERAMQLDSDRRSNMAAAIGSYVARDVAKMFR